MPDIPQPNQEQPQETQGGRKPLTGFLTILAIFLLAVVAVIPVVLRVMYRADAQVALGNAKLVRTALQAAATEAYGTDAPFGDMTSPQGVKEAVYRDILMTTRAPGDFRVLQTEEDGYEVVSFLYWEGEFAVYYSAEPESGYEVYRCENFVDTRGGE